MLVQGLTITNKFLVDFPVGCFAALPGFSTKLAERIIDRLKVHA